MNSTKPNTSTKTELLIYRNPENKSLFSVMETFSEDGIVYINELPKLMNGTDISFESASTLKEYLDSCGEDACVDCTMSGLHNVWR